jgi:hypothetical protein
MKSLFSALPTATALVLGLILSSPAHALEFSLNCVDSITDKPLPLKVVKVPRKGQSGKWESFYFIESLANGKSIRVPLEHAGSGDEDYNEYHTPQAAHSLGLQGASIQNRFVWASIVNTQGSSFASCR